MLSPFGEDKNTFDVQTQMGHNEITQIAKNLNSERPKIKVSHPLMVKCNVSTHSTGTFKNIISFVLEQYFELKIIIFGGKHAFFPPLKISEVSTKHVG